MKRILTILLIVVLAVSMLSSCTNDTIIKDAVAYRTISVDNGTVITFDCDGELFDYYFEQSLSDFEIQNLQEVRLEFDIHDPSYIMDDEIISIIK